METWLTFLSHFLELLHAIQYSHHSLVKFVVMQESGKWALGNITMNKTSGGDGIPAELFQILKDDSVKVLHSTYQQIWKTQQWPQDWKRSVFIPVPKKGNTKECSNYHTIALISHASKVMLKILQASFNSMWTEKFQMFKLDLEKAEEPEIRLPTSVGLLKKQENSRKTSTSASLTMLNPLTVWITTNCGKFLKRWEYQTALPTSWEICMQVKKQQLESDIRMVPNWERNTSRLYIVTLLI